MTDKELLELAAKAAGIDCEWINKDDADYLAEREGLWLKGKRTADNSSYWNPLTDDGDALRLAVQLSLEIILQNQSVEVWVDEWFSQEDFNTDPYAATRRAIVRTAAEIGKGME